MAQSQARLRIVFLQPMQVRAVRKQGHLRVKVQVTCNAIRKYEWKRDLNVTGETEQGHIALSWGFCTQGETGSLSLDHDHYEEGGLSLYPQ